MKPLKLRFQAFASYVEATEIDFEKLDSLFLIHGETGAGKTAILDAMMYALYGESSGGERSDMRCVLPKAAELPTEVEFVFEVRGKKYKFTRSIELTPRSKQLKFKQDGFYFDEETQQFRSFFENPKQELVKQKAEELTGLSADQFRQVIILPQGRFERLLTSDSKEKEQILSTLFAAEKYSRLSDKLYEKADEERRRLDAEETALKAMLAGGNAESAEQLSEETERLSRNMEELLPKLESAKQNLDKLRKELTDAELLSADFAGLAKAREHLAELDSRSGEIDEIRGILSLYERSLKAKPDHAALSEARQMLDSGAKRLSNAEKALEDAEKEFSALSQKQKENSDLEKKISDKTTELTILNNLAEVYEKIGTAEAEVRRFSEEYSECENFRAQIEDSRKKNDAEISEATEKRNQIMTEYSRQLPELRSRKSELERGAENAENLRRYESGLKNIQQEIAKLYSRAEFAEKEKTAFRTEYTRLYDLYITNTAAELSSKLIDGQPCPVCGSLSHPAPAVDGGDSVTSEQVREARDKFEQAEKELSAINAEIAQQEARIPAANEYISGCRRVIEETAYSAQALEEISRKCAEAEKQNASLEGLDKRINSLSAQKRELEEAFEKAGKRFEELREKKTKAEAVLEAFRERLVPDCPDRIAYEAKASALKEEIEAFEREKRANEERFRTAENRKIECAAALKQAQSGYSEAGKRLADRENAFAERLSELGYSDEKQYESSLLSEETAERYSEEAEQYSLERHSTEEAVRNLSEKLSGRIQPNIEQIRAAAEEAESHYGELSRQEALDSERLSRLKELSEKYSKRYSVYEADREKSGRQLAFAKFMRGDRGISFTRYVLSIMLNLVAAEANRILAVIHGGMFRLCVKSELAANSKQGLDLEVENTVLGGKVKYGVKNLSGGEKFLISLALSLGLSQVAQSRAGGVQIEAMFIDEGFGSLGASSLREAVGILCNLSAGRNTIGIISHVEELRTVIPCGVKITKSPEGGSRIST